MPPTSARRAATTGALLLAAGVGLVACGDKVAVDTGAGATTGTATRPTHPGTDSGDADTSTTLDLTYGALELRYGFDGFAEGVETCADVGTKTLWLDLSIGGSVQPSTEVPCVDEPILIASSEIGTYQLQLSTVSPLHDGTGVWGESYAVLVETEEDEITDVYVSIVCYEDGVVCP